MRPSEASGAVLLACPAAARRAGNLSIDIEVQGVGALGPWFIFVRGCGWGLADRRSNVGADDDIEGARICAAAIVADGVAAGVDAAGDVDVEGACSVDDVGVALVEMRTWRCAGDVGDEGLHTVEVEGLRDSLRGK